MATVVLEPFQRRVCVQNGSHVTRDTARRPPGTRFQKLGSNRSDHLTDALLYVGRGEWFDIYKAIECLQAFAGGELQLKDKQWAKPDDIALMKHTANSLYRHRRGGFEPPLKPMPLEQATKLLATLIECAFDELRARSP
jgi:hypothetical protein